MRQASGEHRLAVVDGGREDGGGQARNRTTGTRVFSTVFCKLSYRGVKAVRIVALPLLRVIFLVNLYAEALHFKITTGCSGSPAASRAFDMRTLAGISVGRW